MMNDLSSCNRLAEMQLLEMPAEEMDVPRESKKRKFEELHELPKLKSKKENSRTVDARDRRMRNKKENHRLVKELDASFESLKSLKEDLKQDLLPEPSVMKRVDAGYSEAIHYPDLLRVTNVHHQTEAEDVMKFFRDSNIEVSDVKMTGVSTSILPYECSFKLAPENIKQVTISLPYQCSAVSFFLITIYLLRMLNITGSAETEPSQGSARPVHGPNLTNKYTNQGSHGRADV